MARKIDKPRAEAKPDDGAEDLPKMFPHAKLVLRGRKFTVREYGFLEGLDLQGSERVAEVLEPLTAIARRDGAIQFDAILGVLAKHRDAMIMLIAQAIAPEDWADSEDPTALIAELATFVRKLGDADGQLLMLTWWSVNGGFFVRRVTNTLAAERAQAAVKAKASGGPTSTPASVSTASSAASTSSESSPVGS